MNPSRRSFLLGIGAVAVATRLPLYPDVARAEEIMSARLSSKIGRRWINDVWYSNRWKDLGKVAGGTQLVTIRVDNKIVFSHHVHPLNGLRIVQTRENWWEIGEGQVLRVDVDGCVDDDFEATMNVISSIDPPERITRPRSFNEHFLWKGKKLGFQMVTAMRPEDAELVA